MLLAARTSAWQWGSSVRIKVQGLINAAKWVEREYGAQDLQRVVSTCSPAVARRLESGIAIEWHPLAEFVEFLEAVEEVVGDGSGRICQRIGADSARINTRGFVKRALFYLASPEFLMRRITNTWSQFNDQGSMRLLAFEDRMLLIEVADIPAPHRLFCAVLTGWTGVMCEAFGGQNPAVDHEPCRALGGTRCAWRVRWTHGRDDRTQSLRPGK